MWRMPLPPRLKILKTPYFGKSYQPYLAWDVHKKKNPNNLVKLGSSVIFILSPISSQKSESWLFAELWSLVIDVAKTGQRIHQLQFKIPFNWFLVLNIQISEFRIIYRRTEFFMRDFNIFSAIAFFLRVVNCLSQMIQSYCMPRKYGKQFIKCY